MNKIKSIRSFRIFSACLAMLACFSASPIALAAGGNDYERTFSFVTKNAWSTVLWGKAYSIFQFRPDGTYEEIWYGKDKQGTWSLDSDNKIRIYTPENSTLTFIPDLKANVLRRGKEAYSPVPEHYAKDIKAFITSRDWTIRSGKSRSTFSFREDGTYEEVWGGKTKQGTWSLNSDNKLILKTPEKGTLTFTPDPAFGVIRRGGKWGSYTPVIGNEK